LKLCSTWCVIIVVVYATPTTTEVQQTYVAVLFVLRLYVQEELLLETNGPAFYPEPPAFQPKEETLA
jgi:hypothetical protein